MTDTRPRHFVWLRRMGRNEPQIWFEPFVGTADLKQYEIASRPVDETELRLSLDQLALKYPAPEPKET